MRRIVRIHVASAILIGLAIALILLGQVRVPLAILCIVCLGQLVVGEIVRVTIAPFARKEDR
ncbi:hypothetical protein [Sphingomonas aquatilis]|uniref:hypothetical protein n=1 Tax=Sphingomonas aquatilis TaxID=93063 RepID=UPI0023F7CB88|nr:hypothetical protein [Sphingomonas aquatilis]MCI4653098.1 hypothetical protein [Sphingomonas aquatilis]